MKDECIIRLTGSVVLFLVEMWLLTLTYKKYLVMEWFRFYRNVVIHVIHIEKHFVSITTRNG